MTLLTKTLCLFGIHSYVSREISTNPPIVVTVCKRCGHLPHWR